MATGCSCKKCKPARCTCNRDKRNCGEQCGCFPPKGIQAFFISFDIWTFLLLDQGWTFVVLQNIAGEIAKKEGLQSIEWYLYVLQYLPVYTPCHCRRLIGLALVVATFLSFVKGYNKKKTGLVVDPALCYRRNLALFDNPISIVVVTFPISMTRGKGKKASYFCGYW